jgi:hypothetical protein
MPNIFFGAFMSLTAVDVSGWILAAYGLEGAWINAFRSAVGALQMPLFLGFVLSACYSDFRFRMWDVLHTFPFIVALYLTLPGNQLFWGSQSSVMQKLYTTETEMIFRLITSHIQYYLYIAFAAYVLWQFRTVLRQYYADARSDVFVWLSQLVAVSIFAHTLILVRHIVAFNGGERLFSLMQAAGAVLILVIMTWVTFKALFQQHIFRGIDRTLVNASTKLREEQSGEAVIVDGERQRLLAYMDTKRPYLEPELTLQTLANQLALTPRELSELINE